MDKKLTLGSLFDGSGGFPFGAVLTGIEPLWASEVEPFPIRVTTKRLPKVKHYGDINKIDGSQIPPVDIITAGFCCQDLSVAGKRAGLRGERSGLFFQIIRIINEMRNATNNEYPSFAVLENVPGLYSSNKGLDFLEVLNELIQIKNETLSIPMPETGKWSTAGEIVGDGISIGWRTLDAQFWGVAQRRRRCYIVVDFTGERAGKILFDETRLRGNPPQGCFARQATAGTSADSVGIAVNVLNDQGGGFMDLSENITGTLRSQEHGHQPIVFEPGAMLRLGGHCWEGEPTGALRADMGDNRLAVAIPINTQVGLRNHKDGDGTGLGVGDEGDPAYTLQSAHPHAVAIENHPADSRIKFCEDGVVQTLSERMGTGGGNVPLVMNERQYALTVGEDVANTLTGTDFKGTQCVFEPKTLKIRSGCEGGGKGALIQDNKSATLSCNNDQTVFVPKAAAFMGGQSADAGSIAYSEDVFPTIRGQAGGNSVPMVMAAYGICSQASNSMNSDNPHSGIYEADTARTLDSGGGRPDCNQGGIAVVFDGKQITSKANRSNPQPGSPCHTLASGSADSAVCVQGSMIGRADKNGPQGSGVNEDVAFTLTEVDRHAVCYQDKVGALCASDHKFPQQQQINEGKAVVEKITMENHQHSGYREANVAGTLKKAGGTNGGGSENMVVEKNVASFYPQMKAESICYRENREANTLVNGTNPGFQNGIVAPDENRYVVRRLTPVECALLQGFPLDWCAGLGTSEPTEEDIAFWAEVWETHRIIIGTSSKPKSRNQIIKWLRNPHSDAAEYKMWGNGVALPCVVFVLSGIVSCTQG